MTETSPSQLEDSPGTSESQSPPDVLKTEDSEGQFSEIESKEEPTNVSNQSNGLPGVQPDVGPVEDNSSSCTLSLQQDNSVSISPPEQSVEIVSHQSNSGDGNETNSKETHQGTEVNREDDAQVGSLSINKQETHSLDGLEHVQTEIHSLGNIQREVQPEVQSGTHSEALPYSCTLCKLHFVRRARLENHLFDHLAKLQEKKIKIKRSSQKRPVRKKVTRSKRL